MTTLKLEDVIAVTVEPAGRVLTDQEVHELVTLRGCRCRTKLNLFTAPMRVRYGEGFFEMPCLVCAACEKIVAVQGEPREVLLH